MFWIAILVQLAYACTDDCCYSNSATAECVSRRPPACLSCLALARLDNVYPASAADGGWLLRTACPFECNCVPEWCHAGAVFPNVSAVNWASHASFCTQCSRDVSCRYKCGCPGGRRCPRPVFPSGATKTRQTRTRTLPLQTPTMTRQTRTRTQQTRTRTKSRQTRTQTRQTRTRTKSRQTRTRTQSRRTRTRTQSRETQTRTQSQQTRTRTRSQQTRTQTRSRQTRTRTRSRQTRVQTKSQTPDLSLLPLESVLCSGLRQRYQVGPGDFLEETSFASSCFSCLLETANLFCISPFFFPNETLPSPLYFNGSGPCLLAMRSFCKAECNCSCENTTSVFGNLTASISDSAVLQQTPSGAIVAQSSFVETRDGPWTVVWDYVFFGTIPPLAVKCLGCRGFFNESITPINITASPYTLAGLGLEFPSALQPIRVEGIVCDGPAALACLTENQDCGAFFRILGMEARPGTPACNVPGVAPNCDFVTRTSSATQTQTRQTRTRTRTGTRETPTRTRTRTRETPTRTRTRTRETRTRTRTRTRETRTRTKTRQTPTRTRTQTQRTRTRTRTQTRQTRTRTRTQTKETRTRTRTLTRETRTRTRTKSRRTRTATRTRTRSRTRTQTRQSKTRTRTRVASPLATVLCSGTNSTYSLSFSNSADVAAVAPCFTCIRQAVDLTCAVITPPDVVFNASGPCLEAMRIFCQAECGCDCAASNGSMAAYAATQLPEGLVSHVGASGAVVQAVSLATIIDIRDLTRNVTFDLILTGFMGNVSISCMECNSFSTFPTIERTEPATVGPSPYTLAGLGLSGIPGLKPPVRISGVVCDGTAQIQFDGGFNGTFLQIHAGAGAVSAPQRCSISGTAPFCYRGTKTVSRTKQTRTRTRTITQKTHTRTRTQTLETRTMTRMTSTHTRTASHETRTRTRRTQTRTKTNRTRTAPITRAPLPNRKKGWGGWWFAKGAKKGRA